MVLPAARSRPTSASVSGMVNKLLLEFDVVGKRPSVLRTVDADVRRARLHAKRIELTVIVVRVPFDRMNGDVELVRAFDELEIIDGESNLRVAIETLRIHLFDERVGAVATHAVRVEQA